MSAPYPGPSVKQLEEMTQLFHSWDLEKPGDIIEVYLLLRNLDQWTVSGFRNRIVKGIRNLVDEVEKLDRRVIQWRRRSSDGKDVGGTDVYEPESISSPRKPRARAKPANQVKRRTTRGVA